MSTDADLVGEKYPLLKNTSNLMTVRLNFYY